MNNKKHITRKKKMKVSHHGGEEGNNRSGRLNLKNRENTALFRELSENSLIGIYFLRGGKAIYVNPALAKIFGYAPAEMIGANLVEFIHPDDRDIAAENIRRLLAGHAPIAPHATRGLRKNGGTVYVESLVNKIDLNGEAVIVGNVIDVTERRKSEDRDRDRSRILESLTAKVPLAGVLDALARSIEGEDPTALCTILLLDEEGKHLLHGAAPSMPQFFIDAVHGIEIGEKVGSCGAAAFAGKRIVAEDLSSDPYWADYTDLTRRAGLGSCWSEPIFSAEGKVLGTFGIYHRTPKSPDSKDIQRIKYAADFARLAIEYTRAESSLRESEERFRMISENIADLVAVLNLEGKRVYNSPSYASILGDPSGLKGSDSFNEIHPDDREKIKRIFDDTKRTGVGQRAEYRFMLRDGSIRYIESQGSVIRNREGEMVNVIVVSRDISERKKAEHELAASEARFRTLVEEAPAAVRISRNGRMVYVNQKYLDMFGYGSAGEVVGRPIGENWPPAVRARAEELAALRGQGDENPASYEETAHRKDGTLVPVQVEFATVELPDGPALMEFIVDMTYRKRAEERVKEAELELRQAQKMEAIGRLAGGVAHDFNNLLTVINGYSQLILDHSSAGDPNREQIEEILKAGERAASLTRQLLAFSRKQVIAPRFLDINGVLENIEKMLRRLIGDDVELRVVMAPQLGLVKADPGQVEQVLLNLTVNARDAMADGGTVTIETRNADVRDGTAESLCNLPAGPYVMLSVSDTGCGMSPEILSQIFEPFFTTKEAGKGTGLGLSTVYGIAKQAGGYVAVETKLGSGSAFKVYFPRLDESAEKSVEEIVTQMDLSGSETILVVEDEPAVRSLICEALERQGYKVLEARDPKEALALADYDASRINMLLTDVIMRGQSGKTLADQLQATRPDLRVLFISGYSGEAIAHHGVLNEGVAFLGKPFTSQTLLRKIRAVFDDHKAA